VATISRLLKIAGLFCRISSILWGSSAKETYNFKEPTNSSHPIVIPQHRKSHCVCVTGVRHRPILQECVCIRYACVAMCCSAVCCRTSQGVAGCRRVLPCVAVCCSVLGVRQRSRRSSTIWTRTHTQRTDRQISRRTNIHPYK